MIEILGEKYEEIDDLCAALWRGDLLLFDESCGEDCRAYMVYVPDSREGFHLVNYVGYKAGARMAVTIPKEASEGDSLNIRLSWLRDNWSDTIPIGSFETTKFLKWTCG